MLQVDGGSPGTTGCHPLGNVQDPETLAEGDSGAYHQRSNHGHMAFIISFGDGNALCSVPVFLGRSSCFMAKIEVDT